LLQIGRKKKKGNAVAVHLVMRDAMLSHLLQPALCASTVHLHLYLGASAHLGAYQGGCSAVDFGVQCSFLHVQAISV